MLDIGAAAGYYTLLATRLVGPTGRVIAFEPDPVNLRYLRAHVRQNRLTNVSVLPIAIADSKGTARFGGGTGTGTGRICGHGSHEVFLERLDDLAEREALAPHHIKIDVEGSEPAVLRGGEQLIRRCRPTIFLSTHEGIVPGVHRACCELLESWNYRLEPILGPSVATTTEVLCVPA
jgi:FkbM family methyltransferase